MENKELQLHLYVSVPSVHLPALMQMSEVIFVIFLSSCQKHSLFPCSFLVSCSHLSEGSLHLANAS